MPRPRLVYDPLHPLPRGLNKVRRQYRARDPLTRKWRYFGTEYQEACSAYREWLVSRAPVVGTFTVEKLLNWFTGEHAPDLVAAKQLSPRTLKDYKHDSIKLKGGLGHIPAAALETHHVATYVLARAKTAPGHVNKERACLSAAYTAAVDRGKLSRNPVRGSRQISRKASERLVSDDEYLAVYEAAGKSERIALLLAVRTLQRPADVLKMGPRDVRREGGQWILRVRQNKTGALIDIVLEDELLSVVREHMEKHPLIPAFVHTRKGRRYSIDGIGAMIRRSVEQAGQTNVALAHMRPKGATALYKAGVSIRHIQGLLGHKTEGMTHTYIRRFAPEPLRANNVPIIARIK
jgi:integrase